MKLVPLPRFSFTGDRAMGPSKACQRKDADLKNKNIPKPIV